MTAAATLRRLEETATASIRAAFVGTAEPSRAEMRNDHCPECRETSAYFAGQRWEEITVATLVLAKPSVALLTPAAFRYYLPALMLRCIEARLELDVLPESVIGNISPPNAKATGFADERLRDFTAAQVTAVLAFLRVFEMREKIDSGASEEALEFTPVHRPLARAIRYWTARAESAGA
jgi:uncharacterized protein DUF6714